MNYEHEFSTRLYTARDVESLLQLLEDIEEYATSAPDFRPRRVRIATIRAVLEALDEDEEATRTVVFSQLWPLCMRGNEHDDESISLTQDTDGSQVAMPSRSQEARWESGEARELLSKWLASWAENRGAGLREDVSHMTCEAALHSSANTRDIQAACWTLYEIGWWDDFIAQGLWKLILRDDVAGDVAGSVLVGLGILGNDAEQRHAFIAQWRERCHKRPIQYNGHVAISLALPELVDDALAMFHARSGLRWIDGLPDESQNQLDESRNLLSDETLSEDALGAQRFEMDLKLSFLSHLADALWYDEPSQEKIWNAIFETCRGTSEGRSELMYTGNLAPYCDSPDLVPQFLSVMPDYLKDRDQNDYSNVLEIEGMGVDPNHWSIYLAGERMQEAVRPHQLRGWDNAENLLQPFRSLAVRNTGESGDDSTSPMQAKEQAWQVLALAGGHWTYEEVQTALSRESSGYVTGEIADIVACFGCDPLPEVVREKLTDVGKAEAQPKDLAAIRGAEFVRHRGLENLARSTATPEALDALLHFSYLYGGEVLRSTSDSVDEVAVHLARNGHTSVIDELWNAVDEKNPKHWRLAGISGLHALAYAGLIPTSQWEKFLSLAQDRKLDLFFRSLAVQAIGFLQDELVSVAARAQLIQLWKESRSLAALDLVGRVREALARHGTWKETINGKLDDTSLLFLSDLGLELRDGIWRAKAVGTIESNDMAALFFVYRENPDVFRTAVCDIVGGTRDQAAYGLTFWLLRPDEQGERKVENEVASAMIAHLKTSSRQSVRRYLFEALALGAPEALLREEWAAVAAEWATGARVALADAMGQTSLSILQPEVHKRAVETLELLSLDEAFVVRRSALRAMNTLSSGRFLYVCRRWQRSVSIFERQVAAEGIHWFDNTPHSDIGPDDDIVSGLITQLESDPEPSVRRAGRDSRLANRRRRWADSYCREVERALRKADTPRATMAKAYRFGAALQRTGDDSHLRRLRLLETTGTSPSASFWRGQVMKGLQKQWDETTRKWDDFGQGAISKTLEGRLIQGEKTTGVFVWLWLRPAAGVRGTSGWGGRLRVINDEETGRISTGKARIELADGTKGNILVGQAQLTLGSENENWASFSGQGVLEEVGETISTS